MKKQQVKENFNDLSNSYVDANRRRIIPCFDDLYQTGIAILSCVGTKPRVLDLGAGTGLYSDFLVRRFPDASLTLIDFSEEMLKTAEDRFLGRDNTRYILGDYTTYKFDAPFDIVISALSIHHWNAKEKAGLYQRIHDLLVPGGEFLNTDEIISPYPRLQQRYEAIWFDYIRANGFSDADIERIKQSMELDDPSPVGDQLEWLKHVGFPEADCVYKYLNFAVFYARK
jgi:tRNA (cmo5U34)-methyltransferase